MRESRKESNGTFCIIRTWSQEFRIHQIKVNTPTPFLVLLDIKGRQSRLRQNIDLKINKAKSLIPIYCSGEREREQAMKTNEMWSNSQTFYIYIFYWFWKFIWHILQMQNKSEAMLQKSIISYYRRIKNASDFKLVSIICYCIGIKNAK